MIKDLSLIPMDDLMKEMERRCICFIAAYEFPKNEDTETLFHYGSGTWFKACFLANVLNNDVLNNWNGELRTLQRINKEEEE